MVDATVLDDAKRLVANLRARGDEHSAQVVEHLIVASETSEIHPGGIHPPDHLTFGQAARTLNVRVQTIKNWVATGKIRAVVVDGQAQVGRRSLVAYLDGLRARPAPSVSEPADDMTRREILSLAYPGDILQRLRELLDARQERNLSVEEQAELNRLEKVSSRISATRLREWLRQHDVAVPSRGNQGGWIAGSEAPEK